MSDTEEHSDTESSNATESNSDTESDTNSDSGSDSDDYIDKNQGDHNYGDIIDGRYFLIKKLGYGTFSTIWLSNLIDTELFFAIKVFHCDTESYESGVSEVTKINMLQSFGFKMTKLYEVLRFTPLESTSSIPSICLVMDILTTNVKRLSRTKNLMTEEFILRIIKEISTSLNVLLQHGYLYTDLRPENIMVKTNDDVLQAFKDSYLTFEYSKEYKKICDNILAEKKYNLSNKKHKKKFNLEKRLASQSHLCDICDLVLDNIDEIEHNYVLDDNTEIYLIDFGTLMENDKKNNNFFVQSRNYSAPEILVKYPYSYKIDVWSIGCVLYELLTGVYLFEPQHGKTYSTDLNHIFWIVELLGKFPFYLTQTKDARNFFYSSGKFKEEITEKDWCIEKSLLADDATVSLKTIELLKMLLKIDPKERPSYERIIEYVS